MVSSRSRNLSWNWFTFVLTTISFWVMMGEWDRKLRCRRWNDFGHLGPAFGQQRLGALDLLSVASHADQELAGLDLGLVADGLFLGDAQADERPSQPAESGPSHCAFDSAEQRCGQRPRNDDRADARQAEERGANEQSEQASCPGANLGPALGDVSRGDEAERLLDSLEVLADDRQVLHRNAFLLQLPHRILGRFVIWIHGDDSRPSLRRGCSHTCSFLMFTGTTCG